MSNVWINIQETRMMIFLQMMMREREREREREQPLKSLVHGLRGPDTVS